MFREVWIGDNWTVVRRCSVLYDFSGVAWVIHNRSVLCSDIIETSRITQGEETVVRIPVFRGSS